VRTTIRIDDDLYRSIKEQAARSGRTVAAVLEDAVRLGLRHPSREPAGRFTVRASGSGGVLPGIDLASNASVRQALDEGEPLDALR
jgi:ribbon-helix-helix CopG family protein